jgi:hypothetical protein
MHSKEQAPKLLQKGRLKKGGSWWEDKKTTGTSVTVSSERKHKPKG